MKTSCLPLLFTIISMTLNYVHVGVGTTSKEATLDIQSSNQNALTIADGILIPKINNFPTSNPTAAQDRMMIYVTGSGTPTKGFYYWDQALIDWVAVNDNNSIWSKTGDSGTNSATHVIGTTNARDLSFRTNNVEKMRLTQHGQLEFSNTGNSVFIGKRTGFISNFNLRYNTFVGCFSGRVNANGNSKIFFGAASGFLNTTGNSNSFFGRAFGFENSTGSNNNLY